MSTSFIRAFFAVDLPLECKEQLGVLMAALKLHLKKSLKHQPFRWVKPENLHLTLQFLGQVDQGETAHLLQAARGEVVGLKSFSLRLGPLEWFPSPHRPQVISLRAEPYHALAELSQALGRGAATLGYIVEDRPFRAHLTLARVESVRNRDPALLASFSGEALADVFVKEVVLFSSQTLSGGPVYTRLDGLELEAEN